MRTHTTTLGGGNLKIDLTQEFSDFLEFVGDVGSTIRRHSAFTGEHNPHDVMWLSDSIHDFRMLSKAITMGDLQEISREAASLIGTYTWYKNGLNEGQQMKSDPKDSFQKYPWIDLDKAIAIFQRIKDKADQEIKIQGDDQ